MKNRFFIDCYIKLLKLFNVPTVRLRDGSVSVAQIGDKVDVFEAYSQIIREQIYVVDKKLGYYDSKMKEEKDFSEVSYIYTRGEYLKLKREKLDLQIEQYNKDEFVGQYKQRIKFYEEYTKELTEKANTEIQSLAQKLISLHSSLDTKYAALVVGQVNRYYNTKLSIPQRNQLFQEMQDLFNSLRGEPQNT